MISFARQPGLSRRPKLWEGLKVCFPPCLDMAGGNVPDLSRSSGLDFSVTGTAYSVGASPIGPCLTFTGNAALQQAGSASYTLPCKFCTNSYDDAIFLHAYFKYTHSAGAKESTIFWSDNPTVGSKTYGYRLYVDNNTDKLKLMISNGDRAVPEGTNPTYYTQNGTLTGGQWYNIIWGWWPYSYDTGGGPSDATRLWIDGVHNGYPVVTNSVPSGVEEYCSHLGTQNSRIGATLGSTSPDHSVALVNVWSRGLVDSEVNQLSTDPLAMFRRRRASGAKAPRLVSIGGSALRRMNVAIAG